MKKRLTQKILAAFVVAMLFSIGASAQILTDYIQADLDDPAESVDTVTVGNTTRLYVLPDPVFSPSYNAATNANLGANQRWTWGGAIVKAAANENWLDVTGLAVGTHNITVNESINGMSCTGADSAINVEVIAAPAATFNTTDGTPVFYGTVGAPISICETDARAGTDAFQVTFTHSIAQNSSASIQLHYRIVVDTSEDAGATWDNAILDSAVYADYSGAGTQVTAVTTAGVNHTLAAPTNANSGTPGFVCLNGLPTRYTYEILGVTDRISRKTDWDGVIANNALQGWTLYDTTVEQAAIIVNPVPITGPIYHISNTWAN